MQEFYGPMKFGRAIGFCNDCCWIPVTGNLQTLLLKKSGIILILKNQSQIISNIMPAASCQEPIAHCIIHLKAVTKFTYMIRYRANFIMSYKEYRNPYLCSNDRDTGGEMVKFKVASIP